MDNRLARQLSLGRDTGLRMKIIWEDGFSVIVTNWDQAAAVTGYLKGTIRQYYYDGRLSSVTCKNPKTGLVQPATFVVLEKAFKGPAKSREQLVEQLALAEAKVAALKRRLDLP